MIWVATRFSLIVLIKGDEWNVEDGHVDLSWMWKRPCRCYWVTHWGEISFLGMRLWQKDALSKKCMFFGELFFWNLTLLKDFRINFGSQVICAEHANSCFNVSTENIQDEFLTSAAACFCEGDLWVPFSKKQAKRIHGCQDYFWQHLRMKSSWELEKHSN